MITMTISIEEVANLEVRPVPKPFTNLKLYKCGYYKDKKMEGRVTIFESGKIISVGAKSIQQTYKELEKTAKILEKYNLAKYLKPVPKIRNIVACFNFEKHLNIEHLARTLPNSMYEPEQFPGLIYRIYGSCVATLFSSGKGVLVGAKSIEEMNSAFFEVNIKIK